MARQRALAPSAEAQPKRDAIADYAARGTVWVKQGEFVRPIEVRVGVTDGVQTEVASNDLNAGSEVVLGVGPQGGDEESTSPFLPKLKNDKVKK